MKPLHDSWSQSEIDVEMEYRISERIGIMTDGKRKPTANQIHTAITEAVEATTKLTDADHSSHFH